MNLDTPTIARAVPMKNGRWGSFPVILEAIMIANIEPTAKVNFWLRKLKWPRVTDAQLRRVLMSRDGYHE